MNFKKNPSYLRTTFWPLCSSQPLSLFVMTQKEVNTASNSSPWTVDCVTWTHTHSAQCHQTSRFLAHTQFVSWLPDPILIPKQRLRIFTKFLTNSMKRMFYESYLSYLVTFVLNFFGNSNLIQIRWTKKKEILEVCTSSNKLWYFKDFKVNFA